MRTLKFLLQKEFRQIFRNKSLLPIIFGMPIIQLLVMPLAADYEVKNIDIAIVDHDRSPYSQKLIAKITASGYFRLADYGHSYKQAYGQIEQDKADLILEIPLILKKIWYGKILRNSSSLSTPSMVPRPTSAERT